MIEQCNVIVINGDTVYMNTLVNGEEKRNVAGKVEELFRDYCAKYIDDFNEFTPEEIEDAIENGVMEGARYSVFINWPDEIYGV